MVEIAFSGLTRDDSFTYLDQRSKAVGGMNVSRSSACGCKIGDHALSFAPYAQTEARTYQLYREGSEEEVKNKEESYRS